jgi:hypothetical protein
VRGGTDDWKPAVEEYRGTLALVMAEAIDGKVPNPTRAEMLSAVEAKIEEESEAIRSYLGVRERERIAWALHDATANVLPRPGSPRPIFKSPLQRDMEVEQELTREEFAASRARRDEVEDDPEVTLRLARLRRLHRLRDELQRLLAEDDKSGEPGIPTKETGGTDSRISVEQGGRTEPPVGPTAAKDRGRRGGSTSRPPPSGSP